MLGPSSGIMFGGVIVWVVWLVLTIVAFVAFLRGMHALVQIASQLERIEHVLARNAASGERAP